MRLIDADALLGEINERIEAAIKWGVNAIADGDKEIKPRAEQAVATFCEASLTVKKMPTIDAVEVVRCKDCRWWERDYQPRYHSDERPCNIVGMGTPPEWYCADGERREE